MKQLFTGYIVLLVTLFSSYLPLYGQGNEATIIGKVSEVNASPIIGATVLVRNESTGFQAGTVTDLNGDYIIKQLPLGDRKSTRLNSSHANISYAVFCLKKKKQNTF